ncbi:hypothetical protein CTI12_AA282980 [Artemisia annua]|uniref:Uncharacterized protein n=1 Tax=Artemisia annua TaxID=35608 RepID=A0A2U1NCK1_ARTAN|nr:hypothetical protein CTI12_AA282980 [Artemisia annua]
MRLSQNTPSRSGRGRRRLGDITRANNVSRSTLRSRGAGYSDSAVNLMTPQTYPLSGDLSQLTQSCIQMDGVLSPRQAIGMTRHASNENSRSIRRNVTLGGTQSSGNIECVTNPSVNHVSSTVISDNVSTPLSEIRRTHISSRTIVHHNGSSFHSTNVISPPHTNIPHIPEFSDHVSYATPQTSAAFCSSRSNNVDNGPAVNLSNVSSMTQTKIRQPTHVSQRSTPSARISNSNGSFVDIDTSVALDFAIESDSGSRRTSYQSLLNNDNEIEEYLNCHYISACEACYKIFNFDLHYRSVAVKRLPFHEEDCNRVYFKDDDDAEVVAERSSKTKFTEWMVANQVYPEGRCLTYVDYPSMFTWHDDIKAWKPRKNGKCIGHIYYVSPTMGEKFYLRMLLNIVRGAGDYKEIRTVDDVLYPNYMAACNAYHFLGDDTEWVDTIRGGSQWQRGRQLIDLFVSILLFCDVSDVGQFFRSSLPYLAPDVVHSQRCRLQNLNISFTDEEIDEVLNSNNKSLSHFTELPQIDPLILNIAGNRLIAAERMYNINEEINQSNQLYSGLNHQQNCWWFMMTGFYHHISDLKASFSDMWRINVMVSRIFRPFNPKTNQLLSLDCVFVDERRGLIHAKIPVSIMARFEKLLQEGGVYQITKFRVISYHNMLFRPLEREDVIGILTEWGPLMKKTGHTANVNSSVRNVVIRDIRNNRVHVTIWGELAEKFDDDTIRSKGDHNIVVVIVPTPFRPNGLVVKTKG